MPSIFGNKIPYSGSHFYFWHWLNARVFHHLSTGTFRLLPKANQDDGMAFRGTVCADDLKSLQRSAQIMTIKFANPNHMYCQSWKVYWIVKFSKTRKQCNCLLIILAQMQCMVPVQISSGYFQEVWIIGNGGYTLCDPTIPKHQAKSREVYIQS